jgi:hypothetical protein
MSQQVLTFLFLACSTVCWMNVRAMLRDKCVAGVSIAPSLIFLATNAYEVWYFTAYSQPLVALGAVSMVAANLIWIALAVWHKFEAWVEDQLDLIG